MKLRRLSAIGFIILGSSLVLTGCKPADTTVQSPVILAEGSAQLGSGKNVAVYLEMTNGRYIQASPG